MQFWNNFDRIGKQSLAALFLSGCLISTLTPAYAQTSGTTVWAWGRQRCRGTWRCYHCGQVGDTTIFARPTPVRVRDVTGNGYLSNIISISCLNAHVLALRGEGVISGYTNLNNLQGTERHVSRNGT